MNKSRTAACRRRASRLLHRAVLAVPRLCQHPGRLSRRRRIRETPPPDLLCSGFVVNQGIICATDNSGR